jgi:hypothetical protein
MMGLKNTTPYALHRPPRITGEERMEIDERRNVAEIQHPEWWGRAGPVTLLAYLQHCGEQLGQRKLDLWSVNFKTQSEEFITHQDEYGPRLTPTAVNRGNLDNITTKKLKGTWKAAISVNASTGSLTMYEVVL